MNEDKKEEKRSGFHNELRATGDAVNYSFLLPFEQYRCASARDWPCIYSNMLHNNSNRNFIHWDREFFVAACTRQAHHVGSVFSCYYIFCCNYNVEFSGRMALIMILCWSIAYLPTFSCLPSLAVMRRVSY